MQNPLNYLADNPNNLFEKAKSAVGEKVTGFLGGETGQKVLEKSSPVLNVLDTIAKPYRDYVAPTLSAVLLEMNANYRDQNKNLSIAEQVKHGFELSKQQVSGRDASRRAISPGRALVGLIGSFDANSGVDKIDWSNSNEVDNYFTSGSAQFWSGVADFGFNFLDPSMYVGAKGIAVVKKGLVTRPVGSRLTNVEQMSKGLDAAVVDTTIKSPENEIFKYIEKDPTNIRQIQGLALASSSTNPVAYATMLSKAYLAGGRALTADVIKASIGDVATFQKLEKQNAGIAELLEQNANTNALVKQEIADLRKIDVVKKGYTPEQIAIHVANKEELGKAIEKLDEEAKQALLKSEAIGELEKQEFRSLQTWSKSSYIERVRNAMAAANIDGYFMETDAATNISLAKQVAKNLGTKTPYVRAIHWFSPSQQLHEHPSGLAFTGGAAGEASYKEFDARLAKAGKTLGMKKDEMNRLSNEYRALTSKSERFIAFENLMDRSFQLLIEKHYGSKLGKLSADQQEAINTLVRGMVASTTKAQKKEINAILDKNYTITDSANNIVAQNHIKQVVEQLALERAKETRNASTFTKQDVTAIERALRDNQLTETQVPYLHFGVDMDHFDRVMSENPKLIGNLVDEIIDDGKKADEVAITLSNAEEVAMLSSDSTSLKDVSALGAKAVDKTLDGLDAYYTYVWKPFTLISAKYTSRNLFEGYLRVIGSAIDFNSAYGYSWTDMFTGFRNPGAISRNFQNIGYRRSGKKARALHDAKVQEIKDVEKIISTKIKNPNANGTKTAYTAKNAVLTAADREAFIGADSLSMTIAYSLKELRPILKYKNSGNKAIDSIAKTLNNEVLPVLKMKSENYGSDSGTKFIELISTGKFNDAKQLAKNSNTADIINALHQYRDEVDLAYSKIANLETGVSTTVEYALENVKFALSRFLLHADDTIGLLGQKATLRDELGPISAKGKIRKSHSGVEQMEVYPGVFINKAFVGEAGEMLRMATSSRVSTTRTMMEERRTTGFGLLSNGSVRTTVDRYSNDWVIAHTDYVNNVIMKDAAMRHIVEKLAEGMTPADAIIETKNWVKTGKDLELTQWKREVKYNMSGMQDAMKADFNFDRQVELSYYQVEQYLPSRNSLTNESYSDLYNKALKGFTEEDSAKINLDDRAPVTANKDKKDLGIFTAYKNAISTIFKFVGTLPEDSLVRHPFFNLVHDAEIKRIVKQYEKYGKQKGLSQSEIQQLIQDNVPRIKTAGVNRAYKELMQRLYSIERYTTAGHLMRFVAPFYMAHQNTSRFWLGLSVRNPEVAYGLSKLYNAPYRDGLVYDENGNQVAAGSPWDTEANRDKMFIPTPQFLRDKGVKNTFEFSPAGFDVITQGQWFVIPTLGGPVGELGAQETIKWAAQNTDADKFLRDNFNVSLDEFTQKHILPFYDKTYGASVASNIATSFTPFNSATISGLAWMYGSTGNMPVVGGVLNLFPSIQGRWETRFAAAREEVTKQMLLDNEPIVESKVNEEAIRIARSSLLMESVLKLSPTITAMQPVNKQMQELDAQLASLQSSLGYSEGGVQFVKSLERQGVAGAPGLLSIMRSTTVDNKFSLNANISTIKNVQKNIDTFSNAAYYYQDNPFLGALFNTGYDTQQYSNAANELMYSTTVNGNPLKSRNMSASDADHNAQVGAAWKDYFTNIQYIEDDAKAKGIDPNTQAYEDYYTPWKERVVESIGKSYPTFDTRQMTITLHKSDSYIALAEYFINDQQFMSTVGKDNRLIKGLKEYLDGRREIVNSLEANRKITGVQGLDTNANRPWLLWKQRFDESLLKDYPELKQIYDFYLIKDELNVIDSSQLKSLE